MAYGKGTKQLDPFDLDDRLEMAEKKYPGWIIVKVGRKKITAYNKNNGERLVSKATVGGLTSLENQIEERKNSR